MELPTACTLAPADGAARISRWRRLAAAQLLSTEHEGDLLAVTWADAPGVGRELEALVAAERTCCATFAWTLHCAGETLVLRITRGDSRGEDLAQLAARFTGSASARL
jgi:hypothetical protein